MSFQDNFDNSGFTKCEKTFEPFINVKLIDLNKSSI